jgi:hypothetical protein
MLPNFCVFTLRNQRVPENSTCVAVSYDVGRIHILSLVYCHPNRNSNYAYDVTVGDFLIRVAKSYTGDINPLKTKRICFIYKDPVPTAQ